MQKLAIELNPSIDLGKCTIKPVIDKQKQIIIR